MRPTKFKEHNVIYAKNQAEYQQLPALKGEDGTVISCWKLSWKEKIKLLITGKIWLAAMTFNNSLQPVFITTEKKEVIEENY